MKPQTTSNASTNSDIGYTTLITLKARYYHQTFIMTPCDTNFDANSYLNPLRATHYCGRLLDVQCTHAGGCATAEANRGHFTSVRATTAVAKAIDPTTSRGEIFGDAHRLRLGGIVVNAVIDGRRVAIDVGVTSQAKRSQGGPIQDYANTKLTKWQGNLSRGIPVSQLWLVDVYK